MAVGLKVEEFVLFRTTKVAYFVVDLQVGILWLLVSEMMVVAMFVVMVTMFVVIVVG